MSPSCPGSCNNITRLSPQLYSNQTLLFCYYLVDTFLDTGISSPSNVDTSIIRTLVHGPICISVHTFRPLDTSLIRTLVHGPICISVHKFRPLDTSLIRTLVHGPICIDCGVQLSSVLWCKEETRTMCWQLDPTEGPCRERRRLMRVPRNIDSKYILNDGGETESEGKPNYMC